MNRFHDKLRIKIKENEVILSIAESEIKTSLYKFEIRKFEKIIAEFSHEKSKYERKNL